MRTLWLMGLACALTVVVGCETSDSDAPGAYWSAREEPAAAPAQNTATPAPAGNAPASNEPAAPAEPASSGGSSGGSAGPINLGSVRWLHHNVSGWAQTANLSSVRISGGSITLNYNKARVWPEVGGVNANPWIFVNLDGTWYAATWEWLRFGQTTKAVTSVRGDHIKKAPLNNFTPVSGETYGFMVSGLARDKSTRNVSERSNIVMVRWP
ncbi:MAG: hypothetical protein PHR35_04360 [Kiritimatiellae bacterium]|nr:hypothetical protein [Kiritimatiellia bacterium]